MYFLVSHSSFSKYLKLLCMHPQLKGNVRVTLRPLVETLPCIGAVNISFMELPYLDTSLSIGNRLDIMQLPGIKQLVNFAVDKVRCCIHCSRLQQSRLCMHASTLGRKRH